MWYFDAVVSFYHERASNYTIQVCYLKQRTSDNTSLLLEAVHFVLSENILIRRLAHFPAINLSTIKMEVNHRKMLPHIVHVTSPQLLNRIGTCRQKT